MNNFEKLKEIASGFTICCCKNSELGIVPINKGFCYCRYYNFLSDGDSSDNVQIGLCQTIYLKNATYAIQYHVLDILSGDIAIDGIYVTDNTDPEQFNKAFLLIKDRIVNRHYR